jgi:hypothetical protein
MKRVTKIGDRVVLAIVVVIAAVLFFQVQNAQNSLRHEIHSRCVAVEKQKTILRREHREKLHQQVRFLHKHPHSIPGIPPSLIRQGIATEREIIKSVKPVKCIKS